MNPYLERLKQDTALKKLQQQGRKTEMQTLLAYGNLAKQKHDLQASVPDARMPMAEMIGQSAQEMTKERPARGWRALLSGMLTGASAGLKSRVAKDKQAKMEQVSKVFEWLEANALSMASQNQRFAAQERAEQQLEPLLKDYAQNMKQMAPLARESYVDHMLGRLNEVTGSDYQLSSIDQVNPLKVTVKSPQQGGALVAHDWSERVGGVDADLYQQAIKFEERKFAQDQERLELARQNAQSYQADIESRWNPEKQFSVGVGKEAAKNLAKAVQKAEEENITLEEALYATQEAKDLLATGKVIAGSDLGAYLQRLTGKAFNTEGMTITQLYDTAAAQLYEFAKGNISFGNTNQKEFEFLTSRIPESAKTPQALARMLERFEKKIERKMAKNEALIRKVPDYSLSLKGEAEEAGPAAKALTAQGPSRALSSLEGSVPSSRTFRVQTPTGDMVLVPESEIDEAIAHGGKVIAP